MNQLAMWIEEFLLNVPEETSFPLTVQPLGNIEAALKSLGYIKEPFTDNTNGWQVDFFYYFKKEDSRLCLSGSLWYGSYTLQKIEYEY